jgi:HK97 gp10 family phage protein
MATKLIHDKTVKIEGLRELEKALAEIAEAPRRRIGRNALKAGGEITARKARELAPKDEGHLAESISVSGKLDKRERRAHKKNAADIEQFVGPGNHPQAIMQEFGTVTNERQPFMRPAWDATKDQVLKRIGNELWIGVLKAQKRAARKAAKAGK